MGNNYPLIVFPERLRRIIENVSLERQYPLDYLASSVLWVMGVLVGACSHVKTPLGVTRANMYLMLVGVQGSNKSAPIAWATQYLHDLDHEALSQYDIELQEYVDATHRGDHLPMPTAARRYLTDATTPEALFRVLKENPKGLGQCSDEIIKVFKDTGRYSRHDDEEIYLRLFSGYTLTIDRATRLDVMHVSNPCFSLAGTIQPATFHRLFNTIRVENGLLARFIESVHFEEDALLWNLTEDLPEDSNAKYKEIIDTMINWRDSVEVSHPIEYRLDERAAEIIQVWQNNHELQIVTSGREIDRAIFRKIQIYVLKFALVIQIMKDVDEKTNNNHLIGFSSATLSTVLADYYYSNALDLARSVYVRKLTDREKRVYFALPTEFTTEVGLQIANSNGLGKSCYFDFLSKIRGILIDQPKRGHYAKRTHVNI